MEYSVIDNDRDLVECVWIVSHVYEGVTYIEGFRYAYNAKSRFKELNEASDKDIVEVYKLLNDKDIKERREKDGRSKKES